MTSKKYILMRYIAQKADLFKGLETSTIKISKETTLPQQTVSRVLNELEAQGMIEKSASPAGIRVGLADKGIRMLYEDYALLRDMFGKSDMYSISGKVIEGIGEGKYYLSNQKYKNAIKKAIGIDVFPGTLNLSVEKDEIKKLGLAKQFPVENFTAEKRSFGGATLYKILIEKKIHGAIIIPERTHYTNGDVLEIIAAVELKKELKLKEGDELHIDFEAE